MLQRTLTVQTAKVCVGKSREAIVEEVSKAFSSHPVVAVQVGFDIVRVTFRDPDSCKLARNNSHVNLFGSNCVVQGGGPPPTMVHLFDFPAELGDEPVREFFSGYGNVKFVRRQRYIGRPDIETGTRLVLMSFRVTPPRTLLIGGYLCRLWYKGQPLVCNLCNEKGHKSADCPNKDKCRRCGQSGHFARTCPNPWGRTAPTVGVASEDFPPLPALNALLSDEEGGSSDEPSVVAQAVNQILDNMCDSLGSVVSDISDDSDDTADSVIEVANEVEDNGGPDPIVAEVSENIIDEDGDFGMQNVTVNEVDKTIPSKEFSPVVSEDDSESVLDTAAVCALNDDNAIVKNVPEPNLSLGIDTSNLNNDHDHTRNAVEILKEVVKDTISNIGEEAPSNDTVNNPSNEVDTLNSNDNVSNRIDQNVENRTSNVIGPVSTACAVSDENIINCMDEDATLNDGLNETVCQEVSDDASSICSLNDAQILPFSQEEASSSDTYQGLELAGKARSTVALSKARDRASPVETSRARSARKSGSRT